MFWLRRVLTSTAALAVKKQKAGNGPMSGDGDGSGRSWRTPWLRTSWFVHVPPTEEHCSIVLHGRFCWQQMVPGAHQVECVLPCMMPLTMQAKKGM